MSASKCLMSVSQCSGNFYIYHLIACLSSGVWRVGSQLHSLFLKTKLIGHTVVLWALGRAENQDYKWEEALMSAVIIENILYSFCSMKSCVVVEWTVTIIYSNTSVKTKWTDDFGILDFIAMSSHAIHLSPSKMAAIMASVVLPVEVLSPPECSSCSVQAWPWQNLWDQCGNVLWTNVVLPHFCCKNL